MKELLKHKDIRFYISLTILAVLIIASAVYSFVRMDSLSSRIDSLSNNLASLDSNLASTTDALQSTQSSLSGALSTTQQTLQQQLGGVQSQVGNLSGTLSTIQKLSQIDPELLKKYSKVYFLNDNYVPASLSEIPNAYQYSNTKQLLFLTQALPYLEAMINNASSTGISLWAASAYRSFDEQKALKGEYSVTYGAGTANSFSATQGYSEHQLGTAVDLTTKGLGGAIDGFDGTPAYQWMLNNAYRYGFVLSYPQNNSYYEFEPWHWRFVGVKLATDLHNQGKNFYDMDQRTIDTYLVNIFG